MMRKPGQAVTSPAWPDLASSIPTTATATISTKPNTPRVLSSPDSEGATLVGRAPAPSRTALPTDPRGPAILDHSKIRCATVYRPSQTPHLPLSPERVTPGGAGRLTPEARARSELASPPHRRQTRVKLNRVFFPR
uniref:Uncharacterized protein n=1 Tax=Knipowitschia caucasica TaxID=637954 RepID=A0AAV2K8K9_KNICA